jgi:uncharacterized protein (TIGR03435 family)
MVQLKLVSIGRRILLATLCLVTLAAPAIFGLAYAPQAWVQSPQTASTTPAGPAATPAVSFDVVSIKPERSSGSNHINIDVSFDTDSFIATGVTAKYLIELAYDVRDFQISGGPAWADSEKYAVNAKIDEETLGALKKLAADQGAVQRRLMLQSLLTERFKLKVSHSSKDLPTYALLVSKNGPKIKLSADPTGRGGFSSNKRGEVIVKGTFMNSFADWLSRELGRKVVDKTALEGKYDFTLHWTPERLTAMPGSAADSNPGAATPPSDSGPSIFTALQEQLGLKLESQKGPVETLIIDSIERPSEN